mgnify:CR=1 FL=1
MNIQLILENHKLWLQDRQTGERANLRDANLQDANLQDANLRDANLRDANLRYANLQDADFRYAIGNMIHIKSVFIDKWSIVYTSDTLQIGCQQHPISDWFTFDDATISAMDSGALTWWNKYKQLIKQIIELSPAEPTK